MTVDLKNPGVSFVVTPPNPAMRPQLSAMTVGKFLEGSAVDVAINANFFQPFHSNSPWDYYPLRGDPVKVLGRAASAGDYYSEHEWAGATFYFSSSNAVHLTETSEGIWNAVSGDQWLIRNGEIVAQPDQFGAYPRTAMALNEPANELLLVVVDGKQPPHSAGATLPELARLLHARGAHQAINLDGGGSATLVAADSKGKPVVLNSPIHTRIPGRQRPVANHLGIRIRSRGEAPN